MASGEKGAKCNTIGSSDVEMMIRVSQSLLPTAM